MSTDKTIANTASACKLCSNADTMEMVQCDDCDSWFHFICVGVDFSIEDKPFKCQKCKNNLNKETTCDNTKESNVLSIEAVTSKNPQVSSRELYMSLESHKSKSRKSHSHTSPESQISSKNSSRVSLKKKKRQIRLQQLEEEHLVDKKIQQAEKDYIKKKYALLCELSDDEDDKSSSPSKKSLVQEWVNTQKEAVTHIKSIVEHNPSNQLNTDAPPFVPPPPLIPPPPLSPSFMPPQQSKFNYQQQNRTNHIQFNQHLPTLNNNFRQMSLATNQIAARQAIDKELPIFTGRPDEWPLFFSSFETSTQLCGFSNAENLIRLQKCLKGKAKEAVRSRLLIPSAVPDIIKTLRMLYGRPEVIINSLLQKIKSYSSMKTEKMELIMDFALEVQNVCDTMQSCNLEHHLCNPMLLQELVDKLPFGLKLDWARHRQVSGNPNLMEFSKWLSYIAQCASEVTLPATINFERSTKIEKAHLYTHSETLSSGTSKIESRKCVVCNDNCKNVTLCNKFIKLHRNEKWRIVKQNNICRTCLRFHGNSKCNSSSVCGINGCQFRHHSLLHNPNTDSNNNNCNNSNNENKINNNNNATSSNCNVHQKINEINKIIYRVIPVSVAHNNIEVNTFAFLDEGSSLTVIESSLAKQLKLDGIPEPLCLKWTSETVRYEPDSERVTFEVISNNSIKYKICNARTVNKLSLPIQTISDQITQQHPHLKNIQLDNYSNAEPKLLIGLDNAKLSVPLEIIEEEGCELVATRCRLGWTVHGIQGHKIKSEKYHYQNFHACECKTDEKLHNIIKEHFSIESFGVQVPKDIPESKEHERARKILTSTTRKVNNQYETGLLWKYNEVKFPDSFPTAKRRLLCLEKRMEKDQNLKNNMNQYIQEYVQKGYAKKLTNNELNLINNKWYLPIFAVKNPNKPDKFRIVFDAAAKTEGISLNSLLLSGPDLLQPLIAVFFKFREGKFAICGDIKEMFHQVKIREEDQHAQLFLWKNNNEEIDTYVMKVMIFGATCSPTSAQYVKNLNSETFSTRFPEASKAIIDNHYVDDLLISFNSEQKAIEITKQIQYIHQQGGFEIRNWISNSQNLLNQLNAESFNDKKYFNKTTTNDQPEKVLGMWWDISTDTFTYSLKYNKGNQDILTYNKTPTKREVLRTLMSIFDPLGFLAPFIIQGKMLLQDLWQSKIGWDDFISHQQMLQWKLWLRDLRKIEELHIPRCYSINVDKSNNIQLHTFVDASENSFAAVSYVRVENQNNVECCVIAAKSRVAPTKPLSIPRMELQAAVLGVRLMNTICDYHNLQFHKRVIWTDSKTVLQWLNSSNPRKLPKFVSHRIGEILESSNVNEWRWVPSADNVADDATKRSQTPILTSNSRWFLGPQFLFNNEDEWPLNLNCSGNNLTKQNNFNEPEEIISNFINVIGEYKSFLSFSKFNKWETLLRSTAYVIRAKQKFMKEYSTRTSNELTSDELLVTENLIYNQVQQENYYKEIIQLQDDSKCKISKTSKIYKMSPYLDENMILRVRGRIDSAKGVSFNTKRPIILPKEHHVTLLIVDYYHRRYHHWNNETAVNEIRQKYCIAKLRVLLKTVRHNYCQICKNNIAKPLVPEMGDLPSARLTSFVRPFSYIGIDYFGPMLVTLGRRTEKRWGMLITCLTIRAVHIEIVHNLSTDSCIMALRNFIARRGEPLEIWSDNGTNFKGAANELAIERQKVDDNKLMRTFVSSSTTWKFIPPAAPNMGGAWERLVRSIKQVLYQIMPTSRYPTDEVLRCLLLEAESVVNSRPLTYIPLDTEEAEALTPNHFLLGSSSGVKPMAPFEANALMLRKNWHKAQYLADQFWTRWLKEYLPEITRRTKWHDQVKPIQVGDVVIVVDYQSPRSTWLKGIVIETRSGSGDQVRSAVIKTSNGLLTRPASKLAVLDVQKM